MSKGLVLDVLSDIRLSSAQVDTGLANMVEFAPEGSSNGKSLM